MIAHIWDILSTYGLILLIGQFPDGPLGGLALTLVLAVCGLVCAFPLAVLIGVARTAPWLWARAAAAGFVNFVRGIPALMLIFWAYFAVPLLVGDIANGPVTVICALVIYEMAFLGEVVHAGICALPRGQTEAARALGLGYVETLRQVILPQALYNTIPSILNQFINLIKNTSLAYVIGVDELTTAAYQINAQLLTQPFEVFLILALTYFLLCFSLARLVGFVERRIKRRRTSAPTEQPI